MSASVHTIIVDVANVMGARADGWWRDRAGAAARLCQDVAALADRDSAHRTGARRDGVTGGGPSRNGVSQNGVGGGSASGGSDSGGGANGGGANGGGASGGSASRNGVGGESAGRDGGRYWVMVLEGRARAAAADPALNLMDSVTAVSLVLARGSGDDTMARIAAELGKYCTVVTADRELRRRCEQVGASVTGPRWLLGLL